MVKMFARVLSFFADSYGVQAVQPKKAHAQVHADFVAREIGHEAAQLMSTFLNDDFGITNSRKAELVKEIDTALDSLLAQHVSEVDKVCKLMSYRDYIQRKIKWSLNRPLD